MTTCQTEPPSQTDGRMTIEMLEQFATRAAIRIAVLWKRRHDHLNEWEVKRLSKAIRYALNHKLHK